MYRPAVGTHILEPSLQALEPRLQRHIARGDMRESDVRNELAIFSKTLSATEVGQIRVGGIPCP